MSVDLHTHVLFGMDDGAQTLEDSISMLYAQLKQGVDTVVCTPHFNPHTQDLDEFIKLRDQNFEILQEAIKAEQIDIKLLKGAEIYYSIDLIDMDLRRLTFDNTDYLLIEFSTNSRPSNLTNFISHVISQGLIPIFAHIERYSLLEEDFEQFVDFIEQGVLMQVNGSTFINKKQHSFIKACIKHNLIHLISSDTHNITSRVPNNGNTLEVISKQYGETISLMLQDNARVVISNETVDVEVPTIPRRIFGKYI